MKFRLLFLFLFAQISLFAQGQMLRGFVYAETMQNTPVTSTQSLKKNDKLQLRLADGTVKVTIDHVN